MQIKGVSSGLNRGTVTLPRSDGRDIALTVQALPMGFDDEINRRLPDPQPPNRGPLLDPRSKAFVRDGAGRIELRYDRFDPAYRAAVAANNRRQFALYIVEALQADPNVQFHSHRQDGQGDADYADAIWAELRDFGLSMGDITLLIEGIMRASNVGEDKLREAREAFLLVAEASSSTSPPDEASNTLSGPSANDSASREAGSPT